MRWLRLFRRGPQQAEYVGRHRSDTLAETALPSPVDAVTTAPQPALVQLGFADGTSMEISDDSGASDELRRIAARLIDDPR